MPLSTATGTGWSNLARVSSPAPIRPVSRTRTADGLSGRGRDRIPTAPSPIDPDSDGDGLVDGEESRAPRDRSDRRRQRRRRTWGTETRSLLHGTRSPRPRQRWRRSARRLGSSAGGSIHSTPATPASTGTGTGSRTWRNSPPGTNPTESRLGRGRALRRRGAGAVRHGSRRTPTATDDGATDGWELRYGLDPLDRGFGRRPGRGRLDEPPGVR